MDDFLIIGGGVVGLSLAYQLAGEGSRVRVIDRARPGRAASWAGAGILPPANAGADAHPFERLTALSHRLHARWTEDLRAETGIDNGFRRCGALYLARSPQDAEQLRAAGELWRAQSIRAQPIQPAQLTTVEPALSPSDGPGSIAASWLVPDECQLRNPRHLKALIAACTNRGVTITPEVEVEGVVHRGQRVDAVQTSSGEFSAGSFCLATGAWTGKLGERIGLTMSVKPIRGQILLIDGGRPILRHILNEGPRYLVPRPDGYVLVGSTEEDVGFDTRTTAQGASDLLRFALCLVPALAECSIERSWAGLRPSTRDGYPYLGRAPRLDNLYVAAGHFRGGLHLSPGTAVVMSQLMRGLEPDIDLAPFAVGRG